MAAASVATEMLWAVECCSSRLSSLKQHFARKRSQQEAAASSSLTGDEDAGELVYPEEEEEYQSRPKRRSVSIDIQSSRADVRAIADRRTSLEQWHEARRARQVCQISAQHLVLLLLLLLLLAAAFK